jgi:DNA-binding Lrp family transcriptional regulator
LKNLDDKADQLTEEGMALSESTVRKRVIRLQEDGVIEKFTIRVCREDERCIIAFLTLIPKSESEIKELLRETQILPQCEEVYFLAGQCGVLVKVNVPEITELDALIESFRGRSDVRSVERVCVVLKPIKTVSQDNRMPI